MSQECENTFLSMQQSFSRIEGFELFKQSPFTGYRYVDDFQHLGRAIEN